MVRDGNKSEVVVLAGGHASEHSISLRSAETLSEALLISGYGVHPLLIGVDGTWNLLPRLAPGGQTVVFPGSVASIHPGSVLSGDALELTLHLKRKGIRTAVLGLHGRLGEDGTIQGFLEIAGIAYTGCGVAASAVAMDKLFAKKIMIAAGLPTPAHREVSRLEFKQERPTFLDGIASVLNWPIVVKAPGLGSSVEVHIARDKESLARALQSVLLVEPRALVERFVPGREFTCAIMNVDGQPYSFPVVEIIPKKASWFDLESKYSAGGADEIVPADLDSGTTERIQHLAAKLHRLIGARGVTRTDVILDAQGEAWLLEINTLPGMTRASLVPKALLAAGWDLPKFVRHLVREAEEQMFREHEREVSAGGP